MLAVTSYPLAHIDTGRARLADQVARFRALGLASRAAGVDEATVEAVEGDYASTLVVALDAWFAHRMRGLEGTDGNPANEVRVLAASLVEHGAVFTPEPPIRLDPAATVLGLEPGDPVRLTLDEVERLGAAYFDEIAARYGAHA